MRGLCFALSSVALAHHALAHNTLENTFDILTTSASHSINFLFDVPKNMGLLETFFAGKLVDAPLSSPIITTLSSEMAASGSLTQQTLWGSVAVENVISYNAFEDSGILQLYGMDFMSYRDADPASCPAITSTLASDNTGNADEDSMATDCTVEWHIDSMGVKTTSYSNEAYDPRVRSWYTASKTLKTPNWSNL
jgi:hypothetical protein